MSAALAICYIYNPHNLAKDNYEQPYSRLFGPLTSNLFCKKPQATKRPNDVLARNQNMAVPLNEGHKYKPRNTMVIGTPKQLPVTYGKPEYKSKKTKNALAAKALLFDKKALKPQTLHCETFRKP